MSAHKNPPFAFPPLYLALLSSLRGEASPFFVGEVGFFLPPSEVDADRWLDALIHKRWLGMYPDLLPFACDGFGNLFCFLVRGGAQPDALSAIVFWSYETFRCLPVASSFTGFLHSVGLTSWRLANEGLDPVIDQEHHTQVVVPRLRGLDLNTAYQDLFTASTPSLVDVHNATLRLDPDNAAVLLSLAVRADQSGDLLGAIDRCGHALRSCPELAVANFVAARAFDHTGDRSDLFSRLLATVVQPLVFCGDEALTQYHNVPAIDLDWMLETLATHPALDEAEMDESLWDLIRHSDPANPESWLRVSLAMANQGDVAAAIPLATNALHFGADSELRPEILQLLGEFYDAQGWPLHRRFIAARAMVL